MVRSRSIWPLAAALLLLTSALVVSGDEPPPDPAQQRWKDRKAEKKASLEKRAAAEAARRAKLAEMGIVGVETIGEPGDPAGCVDVVFIGDGFTQEELGAYRKVVERMAGNYRTPPFDAYPSRFNFHRIDLVSKDSGIAIDDADHDTPLGGTRVAFPGGKLLRCNVKTAAQYVTAAVADADYVQVVLNTHGKFLGSANSGQIVLLSTAGGHQRSIVVHEFAHNFAGLLDEYVDPKQSGDRPPPPRLARVANVSLTPNVHMTKWHLWNIPEAIFFGRDRKRAVKPEDIVRCYEGAATFVNGVYRAEENCHMQRGRGKAFCRVCRETLEVRLYSFLTPLASVDPLPATVVLESGHSRRFRVTPSTQDGEETGVRVRWYLDGRRLKLKGRPVEGPAVDLAGSTIPEGAHQLTVVVDLSSPRVRIDRGRLSGAFTWSLTVVPGRGKLGLRSKTVCDAGKPITLAVPAGWILREGPPEAEFDAESRTFSWTPKEQDHGAWSLVFAAGDGEGTREEAVLIIVRSPLKKRNRSPKVLFLPDQEGREGEDLAFRLEAWDPDHDHLAWSAQNLIPGARFDPNSGELTWKVRQFQRGSYEIGFAATDGVKRGSTTVRVAIRGRALFRGIFRMDEKSILAFSLPEDRMVVGLHHSLPAVRLRCAAARDGVPRPQVLAESLRLFRETAPDLARTAAEELSRIFEAAERSGETWHLDMFLDQMPRRIWQFVDRAEDLVRIRAWCESAAATTGLPRKTQQGLQALVQDLARIDQYNEERREWPAPPPITDKKYR